MSKPLPNPKVAFYCWLTLSPFILLMKSPPTPITFPKIGDENFHFCVITKTAIETSQEKYTKATTKFSQNLSRRASGKSFFITEKSDFRKAKLCQETWKQVKKSKQIIKRTKTRAGTINSRQARTECPWKNEKRKRRKNNLLIIFSSSIFSLFLVCASLLRRKGRKSGGKVFPKKRKVCKL